MKFVVFKASGKVNAVALGNIGQVLLLLAFVLRASIFKEYIFVNSDDFFHTFLDDITLGWHIQNRLQWLITVPMSVGIQRYLFLSGPQYLHYLIGMSGPVVLFFVLRFLAGPSFALLYGSIYLSVQVSLESFHIPLGYSGIALWYPLAIIGGWLAGTASKWPISGLLDKKRAFIGALLGCGAAAVYEYYAIVYLVLYLSTRSSALFRREEAQEDETLQSSETSAPKIYQVNRSRAIAIMPVLFVLCLKLLGWFLARDIDGFNTYSGGRLFFDASPSFYNDSILIAIQWILGATIGQHSSTMEVKDIFNSPLSGLLFLTILSAALCGLVLASDWIEEKTDITRNLRVACLVGVVGFGGSTLIMGLFVVQLKAHEVFAWAGVNQGYSQQIADLALPFVCILLCSAMSIIAIVLPFRSVASATFSLLLMLSLSAQLATWSAFGYLHDKSLYYSQIKRRSAIISVLNLCSQRSKGLERVLDRLKAKRLEWAKPDFIDGKDWPEGVCRRLHGSDFFITSNR